MKIAQVVRSNSYAGVERYISLVAPRLAASGCEVTVIGGDQKDMRHISDSVCLRPASSTLQATFELSRLGHLDIVHAHMTAAEFAAVMTKPLHNARLVATLHFASLRGSGRAGPMPRVLGRFMDEQIAISQFVASAVGASRVLLNGVEVADSGPMKRDRTVLVMQRLETEKRTDVALRAWSVSSLRRDGWRLLIAGRGSACADLRELARDLSIEKSTEWLGFVRNPNDLLSGAGILLATAPAEPFGLAVVEAMARATPVIAADGGGHRETIGNDGWLFPVNDVAACARRLNEVERRNLLDYGTKLQFRQRRYFDIDTHTEALLQIYNELIR